MFLFCFVFLNFFSRSLASLFYFFRRRSRFFSDALRVNGTSTLRRSQQAGLVAACREMGVAVTAWSPLGKGASNLLTHPTLTRIATSHHESSISGSGGGGGGDWAKTKTAADVALRWNAQRGVAIIPKSTSASHLANNLTCADGSWSLTGAEMKEVASVDLGKRRVPDFIGVWPTTSHPAAVVLGRVLGMCARVFFTVVPITIDLKAPQ